MNVQKTERHGKCGLCHKSKSLELSHIIPRLLSKNIRKTPSKVYTVIGGKTNHPVQDTQKELLLCSDCEKKFNKLETYYSNYFKYPNYDNRLYSFLLSILWRVVESASQKLNEFDRRDFNRDIYWKESARAYLDSGIIPNKFPKLYLFRLGKGTHYDFLMHADTYYSDVYKCDVSVYHRFIDGYTGRSVCCKRNEIGDLDMIISTPLKIEDFPVSINNTFFIGNRQIFIVSSEDLITCIAIDGEAISIFSDHEVTNGNGFIYSDIIPCEINNVLSDNLKSVNRQKILSHEIKEKYDFLIKNFMASVGLV